MSTLDDMFDPADGGAPGRDDTRPRHRVRRVVVTTLVIVLALVLGYGGYYWFRVNSAVDNLERSESMMPQVPDASRAPAPTPSPTSPDEPVDRMPVSFVLMGSDSRGADVGRSDVLMVAYLSGDRKNLYLVSFPRDMWVPIPGHGEAKINAAYAYGGPGLTVQTLESLLGVRMDHAVGIDFDGFVRLTSVLGGVTVNNKHESTSGGYHFPVGEITVQGDQALAYVRERYQLPNGDLDRAERQRAVVSAIIDKVATREVLANPAQMGAVLDEVAHYVTVDSALGTDQVFTLARQLGFSGSSGIRSLQAPITGFGTSADGQSIDVVDWPKMSELAKAMQTDTMEAYYQASAG